MDIRWDSGWPKMVKFYKNCLEWPFHHMNIPNTYNEQAKTLLSEKPHISRKLSKARNLQIHFRHLEYEFCKKKNGVHLLKGPE